MKKTTSPTLETGIVLRRCARAFAADVTAGEPIDVIHTTQRNLIQWAKSTLVLDGPIRNALAILGETGPDPRSLARTKRQLYAISTRALAAHSG